jgi:pimeloyl-ACP methyl ester carboxylesterase
MRFFFFLLLMPLAVMAQVKQDTSFVSFDGTKIHYWVQGEGKPVVLVHGFISNSNSWKKAALLPELIKAGYQVILLDLRGNGLSDRPHTEAAYANNAECRDIMALVTHLKIKKYDVVGYSRGAILTARLLTMDKNIRAAVMGGMGTDFTNPAWSRRKMFQEAFQGKAHLYPETQGAINYARSIGADTVALGRLQQFQPVVSAAELWKIKIPVLVVSGAQDSDNGKAADLAKLLPKSVLKTVPGDHNTTSATEPFAKEVVAFLNSAK